jgi:MYXO-CTERM domain-containing protein
MRSGDEAEEIVWEQGGLVILPADDGVSEGLVAVDTQLLGGSYAVQGRAVDDTGLEGAWGPANSFVVFTTPGPGVDLNDFGPGCGCSAVAGSSRSSRGWLVFLIGTVLLRRRRRSS